MPHCLIEYSQSLEQQQSVQSLLQTVFAGVEQSGLFERSHIRVRATAFEDVLLAKPDEAFLHVTVRLHQGRSSEQRKHLSSTILEALLDLGLSNTSITVETVEMDTASYSKQHV